MIEPLKNFEGMNLTINTNEDCNLACKYCYEINKKHKVIPKENIIGFIDRILEDPDPIAVTGTEDEWMLHTGVILDFIGGDALMHPDIVDFALTYLVQQMNIKNHRWKDNWRASISTNGTLFETKGVKELIEKWRDNLSIGISIDGCPEIHDKNRIMAEPNPDGSERGSMQYIMQSWPWVKKNLTFTPDQTKSTLSKDSIPYIFESLKFMHETLGMHYINQNFIMEANGCTDEDYMRLDEEMEKCVDYLIEHRHELYWSMVERQGTDARSFDIHAAEENLDKGWCGSGAMPCVGMTGKIYPCFRWLPHTLADYNSAEAHCVGDIKEGFTHKERFREVKEATRRKISSKYCMSCEYEAGCPYCIGGCFSEFGKFKRTEHICTISKIRNKWARIYWKRVEELEHNNTKYLVHNINEYYKGGVSKKVN